MTDFENDLSVDRSLLIFSENTPHCKIHNAMMLLNGIWRCYGTYQGQVDSHIKFIERTCNCAITDEEWKVIKSVTIEQENDNA